MPITKSKKELILNELSNVLDESKFLILFNYSGLKSNDLCLMRKSVAEKDSHFKVIKNRLLKIWAEKNSIEFSEDAFDYPTAVLAVKDEVSEIAKLFTSFSKENDNLVFKSALLDSKIVGKDSVKMLADLPSREVLISQLLSSINSPRQNLVRCLNHPISSIVQVLYKIKENKKEEA